jgi:flagellar hook-associated protein 1 FlgK
MDKRDQLLDKLSSTARSRPPSTPTAPSTSRSAASPPAARRRHHRELVGPPAGWSPGGRLGGLMSLSQPGGDIDSFIAELDTIANTVATSVNGALAAGTPPFFTGNSADTIAVNPAAQAAPQLLAGGPGAASDENAAARAVEALRGGAADKAYRAFVARMGTEVADADRKTSNAQVLVDSVEDRRQSVAGVSLDEEMSNLVRFQRAYQASARAMSTMDEMLDVLINRTGKVGL